MDRRSLQLPRVPFRPTIGPLAGLSGWTRPMPSRNSLLGGVAATDASTLDGYAQASGSDQGNAGSALSALQTAENAASTASASGAINYAQGSANNISDAVLRGAVNAQIQAVSSSLNVNLNAAQQAAQAKSLTANATALDNDVGYTSSQGNIATTTAGAAADASQGGAANSAGGVGNIIADPTVVNASNIGAAIKQAFGPGGIGPNVEGLFAFFGNWWKEIGGGLIAVYLLNKTGTTKALLGTRKNPKRKRK